MLPNQKKCFFLWLLALSFLITPFNANAQFASWISPGKLSSAHRSLEGLKNCTQCHSSLKGTPDKKCLNCHTEIQQKLTQNKGFHAAQTIECSKCHNEHQGRKYDLLGLTRINFKHDQTGWSLKGKHKTTPCKQCHTQKRKNAKTGLRTNSTTYLQASPRCISCHTDIHKSKNQTFQRCQICHNAVNFKSILKKPQFNHNRQTKYILTGAHQKAKCFSCHTNKKWAPLKFNKCTNCHSDPHKGKFGLECNKCHSTISWKTDTQLKSSGSSISDFDHQKTRFPLTGQHRTVPCKKCHGNKIGKIKNFSQCNACHNSPHGTQFQKKWKVKKCSDCHITEGFKILSFVHNKNSRYPLTGKHQNVACNKCHSKGKYRWLDKPLKCNACHEDVHKNQFGKQFCASCHNTKGFKKINFDHNNRTSFPLIGKHKAVKCSNCHQNGKYKGLSTKCSSCHNDFHRKELGTKCSSCHSPKAFNKINFDHNKRSKFKLQGQHKVLKCNQCHFNFKYKIKLQNCQDCHNDVHKKSFGQNCKQCHTPQNFKVDQSFHDFGDYQLKGAHDRLNCLVCHSPTAKIVPQRQLCSSCHKDPHMNALGQECQNCHSQNSFLPSRFRHQTTGFELSGAHRFLSCNQCHFNRVFGGLPSECSFCHIKSFAPASQVPAHASGNTNCRDCHRTYGWRPTKL